ncbi:MAG: CocE/NonD family hydrolase [Planctomycetes bacterium]|nr:CocE/NonD family hydrolase [Planctomycetota bacterium]
MARFWIVFVISVFLVHAAPPAHAQTPASYIRDNYTRSTHKIKMRDGIHLYTIVYAPKDKSQKFPIIMTRTPYSIPPYEEDKHRFSLGPNRYFAKEGYIFVYQDVRGRYMSEGVYQNMRPQLQKKGGPKDIDESTDTFDSIDWLVKNVPNNNGKVGLFGISYPGFYTAAGMVNAHPALKAASPQAPIADWFFDDFFHHGAFFLSHAFPFFDRFGDPRGPVLQTKRKTAPNYGTVDGYRFFLDIGPLKNVNPKHYKNQITFWNEMMEHPTYDKFWKERNLLPHLKNVAPAVMTVGGWFDAEDLYGIFNTYQAVEKQNPGIFNVLVIGPWAHGAWSRSDATSLGHINFGSNTAEFYQKNIELPFFNHHLKAKCQHKLPEAYVFETGKNQWRQFDHWPPRNVMPMSFFFAPKGRLTTQAPKEKEAFDSYLSDPNKPVPTTERIAFGMPQEYMTDDMRFASARPDVLTYQTAPLGRDVTLAGPINAEIHVATTGTDSDWIVKVIDVFPDGYTKNALGKPMGGYQMHVRSEVIRGRYRNSFSKPEPFLPNEPVKIKLTLQDVLHTFKKGHRIMVQVHSTWFPLVDRNPQKYVPNIFFANDADFTVATQRVYRTPDRASRIRVGILPTPKAPR